MIFLIKELCCAAAAFVPGVAIAGVNYTIARKTLTNRPELFTSATMIRQVCSVIYLVVAYFVSSKWFPDCLLAILLGAALGVTLPSILFTSKLLRLNSSLNAPQKEDKREEEG